MVTLVVNIIIEYFLIAWLFTDSTYQFFYTLSAGMILLPYLLSAAYFAKVAFKEPEAFKGHLSGPILWWRILGCVGVVPACSPVVGGACQCHPHVPSVRAVSSCTFGQKERGEKYFQSTLTGGARRYHRGGLPVYLPVGDDARPSCSDASVETRKRPRQSRRGRSFHGRGGWWIRGRKDEPGVS